MRSHPGATVRDAGGSRARGFPLLLATQGIPFNPGRLDGGDDVKTTRERADEKRREKLDLVREQVASGSLVIRKMTDEERRRYPPRPSRAKRTGKR